MRRLFVGLEIPETLRNALYDVRGGVEGAHWQRDDQLHLTLAFIGDASRRTMHEIEGELSRIDVTPKLHAVVHSCYSTWATAARYGWP